MLRPPPPARAAGQARAPKKPVALGVLISGGGSNLQALIDAQAAGGLGAARIAHVLSNRASAFGLQRAAAAGIDCQTFNLKAFCAGEVTPMLRRAYDAQLAAMLNALALDVIVLAGWMHIFSDAFLSTIQAKVINLHPALPGQFVGAHGIEDAYAAWQAGQITHTGCMVHEVIEQVDAGRVLDTQTVPCVAGDALADLEARMHAAEHRLIVRVVRKYHKSEQSDA